MALRRDFSLDFRGSKEDHNSAISSTLGSLLYVSISAAQVGTSSLQTSNARFFDCLFVSSLSAQPPSGEVSMQLTLSQLSYSYPQAASPVFSDLSATFSSGWTGIIGDNGCGKSTLLSVIAGRLTPQRGSITPSLFSVYCPQDSTQEPEALEDFALDWSGLALSLRRDLEIEEEWLWNYSTLSGGQQKRIQIACALWQQPDVFALDEPTNDLDGESRQVVYKALQSFSGIGLLVSHDRRLLNNLVTQCLVFEGSRATLRPGSYQQVAEQISRERTEALRNQATARKEATRLKAEAQRRSQESARSKDRLSGHQLNRHDNDGRGKLRLARVTGKDGIAGRATAALTTRAEKAAAKAASTVVTKRYGSTMTASGSRSESSTVAHLPATTLEQGSFKLTVPELWISPIDHIGLQGRNGAGKTTLIRALIETLPPSVQVGYLPQSVDESERAAILSRLNNRSSQERGTLLSFVAQLNSDPERILEGGDISPGELRKLLLAEALLNELHLLILDEPTNHLDMGSIEALETLLCSFPGAFLLVSHDATLRDRCCDTTWSIQREPADDALEESWVLSVN